MEFGFGEKESEGRGAVGDLAGVSHVEYLGDRFGVNLDDLGGFVVGVAEGDAGG